MTKSLGVVSMASWCGSHAWPTWYTSVEKGPPSWMRGRQRALPAFQWDLWWWLPLKKNLWCIEWVSTQWGGLKPGWISGSSWRQWLAEFLSDQYWVQSVKPLDDGAECSLSKFVGDTKMGGAPVTVDGNAAIQNDLKWVNRNVMRFNKENCKVLHLGRSSPCTSVWWWPLQWKEAWQKRTWKSWWILGSTWDSQYQGKYHYRFPLDIYYISHNFIR